MGGWRRQGKGAGEGGRGRGGKGGASQRASGGKGEAGEAGSPAGAERRPHWAPGSRRLLTIPGRRAAGRLLLPLSQALGPWGSHARSGCRLAFPAAPPRPHRRPASGREGRGGGGGGRPSPRSSSSPRNRRRPPTPPGRAPAAGAGLVPHASPRRSLTSSGERPPGPTAAAPLPARRAEGPPRSATLRSPVRGEGGAGRTEGVWGGGFAAEGLAARPRLAALRAPLSAAGQRPPARPPRCRRRRRPPPPTRQAGPRPRGRRFRAPGAAWPRAARRRGPAPAP